MQIPLLTCSLVGKWMWYVDPRAAPVDLAATGSFGAEPAVPEVDPSPGGATALDESKPALALRLTQWLASCMLRALRNCCGSAPCGGKPLNMCTIHSMNDGVKAEKYGLLLSEQSFSLMKKVICFGQRITGGNHRGEGIHYNVSLQNSILSHGNFAMSALSVYRDVGVEDSPTLGKRVPDNLSKNHLYIQIAGITPPVSAPRAAGQGQSIAAHILVARLCAPHPSSSPPQPGR